MADIGDHGRRSEEHTVSPIPSPRANLANPASGSQPVADPWPCPQRGAALLVFLGVIVLIAAGVLLSRLNAAIVPTPNRDPVTAQTLAQARDALVAWAATHPDTPGLLPFPDRSGDGDYDGTADCPSSTVVPGDLLGRFPIVGERAASGCAADAPMSIEPISKSGQRLWYAVSQNLVRGGGGGPINPDIAELATLPWLTVRRQDGTPIATASPIAAVIIDPGPAIATQDRSTIVAAAATEYPKYLDSVTISPDTFVNADFDACLDDDLGCATPGEDFIIFPQTADAFNDRLVFITVDELMGAVEDRVLGEAARALRSYKGNNPGNFYPWMSTFTDPRSYQGNATSGGATTLVDGGADFLLASVSDGDLVRNLTDGSIGSVATGGVTATTLTLVGLIGGTGNSFAAGDRYVVHAADRFQGNAGTVEGMLPLHLPNEVFQTGFAANWDYAGAANDDAWLKGDDGNAALIPTEADVDNFSSNGAAGDVTVLPANGQCKWTTPDRVDCWGIATILGYVRSDPPNLVVDRTVEVWFNFTADTTTITALTATDVRRRSHTYNGPNYGPVPVLAAPDMPQKWSVGNPCASGCAWTIHVEDTDGVNVGWRRAERDSNTDLVINKFDGIRYEIAVPDELPSWFAENNWHHFVHSTISGANLPVTASTSGDGTCRTPPLGAGNENDDCLTIQYNGATVRDDVEALVIGPGAVLAAQDRSTATACAPQPAFLCDYFEGPNSDPEATTRNLIYGRVPANTFAVTGTFNDRIRAVPP